MTSRLPALLVSVSALTACAGVPTPPPGPATPTVADNHRIEVTQENQRLDIAIAPGQPTLTSKARSDLAAFASGYLRTGHGALIMSTPSGAPNADAASLAANEARLTLTEAGVPYAAIAGSTYDASGAADAPIIVTFTRFEAQAPDCEPLSTQNLNGFAASNNQPWPSFGCSRQANLAAMIEDPRDLLYPRDEDPRDSNRRAVMLDHYRSGEVTHATRDADERITISNAVQ